MYELVLQAISPDIIGNRINRVRFSSKAYSGNIGDGAHFEAPGFLEQSERNFRKGDTISKPTTFDQSSREIRLTDAQEKHFEQGFLGYRPSTPTTPSKTSLRELPEKKPPTNVSTIGSAKKLENPSAQKQR